MVELGARILIAGILLFVAGVFGLIGFDFAWKTSLAISAIGLFGWQLEAKGFKNPGVAGFFAIADAYTIALTLANLNQLSTMGFLVLAPCAYAAARHASPPNFMAPLAASSLLVGYSVFHQGQIPDTSLLLQAAGVMAIGLLLSHTKIVQVSQAAPEQVGANEILLEKGDYLEMRENFRKLRDAYRDLESKSRRGRIVASLDEARNGPEDRVFARLINKVKEVTGADHAAIYTVAQLADQFVVRATTAEFPAEYEDASLRVDLDLAPGQIKHRMEQALLAVKADAERSKVGNIVLIESGRVIGMLTIGHSESSKLAEAQTKAEEIGPYLAALLQDEIRRESERRRLKETELLYEVATVAAGSTSPTNLASRVVRELFEGIGADHVGVFFLEGSEAILLAQHGINLRLLETMRFTTGDGIAGWNSSGCPELLVFDARDDHRIDTQEALKRRVGSFVLIPLSSANGTIGYLTAATHSRGGLDKPEIETLQIAAVELAQAIQRLEGQSSEPEGVMTPAEFSKKAASGKGALIYLEPLRREQLAETFGKSALHLAIRKFVGQLRRKLPKGGCICRRDEGDYVVFLPTSSIAKATTWANDAAASAAMIAVRTADGSAKIPLALRAKVAMLDRQEDEVFDAITA